MGGACGKQKNVTIAQYQMSTSSDDTASRGTSSAAAESSVSASSSSNASSSSSSSTASTTASSAASTAKAKTPAVVGKGKMGKFKGPMVSPGAGKMWLAKMGGKKDNGATSILTDPASNKILIDGKPQQSK